MGGSSKIRTEKETYTHDLFTDLPRVRTRKIKAIVSFSIFLLIPHSRYEIPDTARIRISLGRGKIIHAIHTITRMDRDIERLLLLKELEIDEQTIVFFCSDNGAAQRWEGRFDSSGVCVAESGICMKAASVRL